MSGPVTLARYTGQKDDEERQALGAPPDILLTKCTMLGCNSPGPTRVKAPGTSPRWPQRQLVEASRALRRTQREPAWSTGSEVTCQKSDFSRVTTSRTSPSSSARSGGLVHAIACHGTSVARAGYLRRSREEGPRQPGGGGWTGAHATRGCV